MDAVSYSLAAKQKQRIERVINDPDSTSGIITVPKVIEASESVTIPAGRMAILPDVQVDGTLTVDGDVFVPSGATTSMIDAELALKADQTALDAKQFVATTTSNVMVDGSLAISNTLVTKAFVTKGWTGTGASNPIDIGVGGIDFTVANNGSGYWHDRATGDGTIKDDAGNIVTSGSIILPNNKFILDVHIKSRTQGTTGYIGNNARYDGLRGVAEEIYTNDTAIEANNPDTLISFDITGFTVDADLMVNNLNDTYISYTRVYTHMEWGLTSQGKRYICAYNPITRQTLTLYQGSGNAGHQIPNPLGIKYNYFMGKDLSMASNWTGNLGADNTVINLNTTNAITSDSRFFANGLGNNTAIEVGEGQDGAINVNNDTVIAYGFANSETQIITQYGGTGASGNFVPTNDVYGVGRKPRMVITKSTSTGDQYYDWAVLDTERGDGLWIAYNLSDSEVDGSAVFSFNSNGFTLNSNAARWNHTGVQYIAIAYFDSQLSTTINTLGVL